MRIIRNKRIHDTEHEIIGNAVDRRGDSRRVYVGNGPCRLGLTGSNCNRGNVLRERQILSTAFWLPGFVYKESFALVAA